MSTATRKRSKARRGKAEQAAADAAPVVKVEGKAAASGEVYDVVVGSIDVDAEHGRLAELLEQGRVEELARSMHQHGQLEPIGVVMQAGGARLVYGMRRLMAAKLLGWETIRAVVLPIQDEKSLLAAREAENVHRQDLHVLEEAAGVVRLLRVVAEDAARTVEGMVMVADEADPPTADQLLGHPAVMARAYEIVAARLCKPVQWVRDRAFLARLDGAARQLVLEGRLPMAHAREIAKLADPQMRNEFARQFAAGADAARHPPATLETVRAEVAKHLYSLAVVPWRLDQPFAGAPACVACPHNSANQAGLFDSYAGLNKSLRYYEPTSQVPKAGACTLPSCFKRKKEAANAAARSAADKAMRKLSERELKAAAKQAPKAPAVADHTPAYVEPRAVAEIVHAKAQRSGKRPARASKPKEDPRAEERLRIDRATSEWRRAMDERARPIEKKVAGAIKSRPGSWAMLCVLQLTAAYQATQHYDQRKRAKAVASRELKALLALLAEPSWDGLLKLEQACNRRGDGIFDTWRDGSSGLVDMVAAALGVEVDPPPTLESFIEKAKASAGDAGKSGGRKRRSSDADEQEEPAEEPDELVDDGEGG